MKVYITKYALTRGIIAVDDAEVDEDGNAHLPIKGTTMRAIHPMRVGSSHHRCCRGSRGRDARREDQVAATADREASGPEDGKDVDMSRRRRNRFERRLEIARSFSRAAQLRDHEIDLSQPAAEPADRAAEEAKWRKVWES